MEKDKLKKKIYQLHSELCKSLAHPKRLEILNCLREGERSVGELLSLTNLSKANLSQHLAILRQNRIVSSRKEGVNIFYRITSSKMVKACDIIREVLLEQLEEDSEMRRFIKDALTTKR